MIKQLPFEIVEKILAYLGRNDLKRCKTVSKLWNRAALEKLRETICTNDFVTEKDYDDLFHSLKHNANAIKRIKHVDLYIHHKEMYYPASIYNLLREILERCPNIVEIVNSEEYSRATQMIEWWDMILNTVKSECLPLLNTLPKPEKEDLYSDYYKPIAYAIRSRLKELYLFNGNNSYYGTPEVITSFYNNLFCGFNLAKFLALEKLALNSFNNETLLDYDSLINRCTMDSIRSLVIRIDNPSVEDRLLFDIDIIPQPNIKQFSCTRLMLNSDISVKYLIEKFPKLSKLSIKMEDIYTNEPYPAFDISAPVLNSFLSYMSNIPELNVTFCLKPGEVEKCIAALVNSFKYLIQLEIVYESCKVQRNYDVKIFIASPVEGYTITAIYPIVFKMAIYLPYNFSFDHELPHLKWLDKLGDKIHILHTTGIDKIQERYILRNRLNGIKGISRDKELSNILTGDWIFHEIRRTTSANCLIIEFPGEVDTKKEEEFQPNDFIQQLKLVDLEIDDQRGCRYFFNSISKCLPSLNYMFIHESYCIYDGLSSDGCTVAVDMPFTSFEEFIFSIDYPTESTTPSPEDHEDCVFYLKG